MSTFITTRHALRAPNDDEWRGLGAAAMRTLANDVALAIPTEPGMRIISGTASGTLNATFGNFQVLFPTPFAQVPIVIPSNGDVNSAGAGVLSAAVVSAVTVTTGGFYALFAKPTGGTYGAVGARVNYIAIGRRV